MTDETTFEARRTSFGAAAAAYDHVRPAWPADTVHWLLGSPDEAGRVLDLGAGTGLGTRTVAGLGHEVVAVDPSAEMLAALRAGTDRLAADVAGRVRTRVGPAEEVDEPDGSFDAVTAFQAWHWFDAEGAAAECARLVRPGGWLGLAWNSWSPAQEWVHELAEVTESPEMVWREGGAEAVRPPVVAGFAAPENTQFPLEQELTVDDLVTLAASWSQVAVHPQRGAVLAEVHAVGARAADADGRLALGYVSDCYRYRRDAGSGASPTS